MTPADPYPVLRMLQSHLEGRLRQGETRLWLTGDAAQALREIVRMKPRPRPPGASAPALAAPAPQVPPVPPTASEVTVPPAAAGAPYPQRLVLPDRPAVPEAALEHPAMAAGPRRLTAEEKATGLAALRERVQAAGAARGPGALPPRMVFAAGSPMAGLVLVGTAPGAEEARQGEPFVGRAGQLLTKVLKGMGLERPQVYLTNIFKYPAEPGGDGPRGPTPEETASAVAMVREEIAIIQPQVIVALGGTALAGLLGRPAGGAPGRGQFYEFDGIPVMATLDPADLLQQEEEEGLESATAEKRKLWEDMLRVMEKTGMPISAKQRRFFLPK